MVSRLYLDTSVAVHALGDSPAAEAWFDDVTCRTDVRLASSRLLRTELTRFLRRDGFPIADRDIILRHVDIVPVSEAILTTAEAIADHVKTLHAIHLASALALGSDTTVITHDANVARVATSLGLATFDPMTVG